MKKLQTLCWFATLIHTQLALHNVELNEGNVSQTSVIETSTQDSFQKDISFEGEDSAQDDSRMLGSLNLDFAHIAASLPGITNRTVATKLSSDERLAYIFDQSHGLRVFDISKLDSPRILGSIHNNSQLDVYDLELSSDELTIVALVKTMENEYMLQSIDVSNPRSMKVKSSSNLPDVPRAFVLSRDDKLAYVSGETFIYVMKVSNFDSWPILGSIMFVRTEQKDPGSIHLSKDEKTVFETFASPPNIYAIDVSNPESLTIKYAIPYPAHICRFSDDDKTIFASKYDVSLMQSGVYIYAPYFEIVNISIPTSPRILAQVDLGGTNDVLEYAGNIVHVGTYYSGYSMIDVQDYLSPRVIQRLPLTLSTLSVISNSGRIVLAGGENNLHLIEVYRNIPKYLYPLGTSNIIGRVDMSLPDTKTSFAISHDGRYIYVSGPPSHIPQLTTVVDLFDPKRPSAISPLTYFDEAPHSISTYNNGYNSGYVFFACNTSGVYIKTVSLFGGTINIPTNNTLSVALTQDDQLAFFADGANGLHILDISYLNLNLDEISVVASYPTSYAKSVALSPDDKTAFLADVNGGFKIIDVTQPNQPILISSISMQAHSVKLSFSSKFAFVTDEADILQVIDVSDLTSPKIIQSYSGFKIFELFPDDRTAFVWSNVPTNFINVMDLSDLNSPRIIGSITSKSNVLDIKRSVDGKYAFLIGEDDLQTLALPSQYMMYLFKRDFMVGKSYSQDIILLQENDPANNKMTMVESAYKFTTFSLYNISFSKDRLGNFEATETVTPPPSWITLEKNTAFNAKSTAKLKFSPNTVDQIGSYTLQGMVSLEIPTDAFIGIGPISTAADSQDLIVHLISLDILDNEGFLTSKFDPNQPMLLDSVRQTYEYSTRERLAQYLFTLRAPFEVTESLFISLVESSTSNNYISFTTPSLNPINLIIKLQSKSAVFIASSYPALYSITNNGTTIIITGPKNDVNQTLKLLRINLMDNLQFCDCLITVSDGINPDKTQTIPKISSFVQVNTPPIVNKKIQPQIDKVLLYTGTNFNIKIDSDTFIDMNNDSLHYTLTMQDNMVLPHWLELKDLTLVGLPPEKLSLEVKLKLIATDGYHSVEEHFILSITPSFGYILKIIATYIGPIIGLLGAWTHLDLILNFVCKKIYRHPRKIIITEGIDLTMVDIFPLRFIGDDIPEINRVLHHLEIMFNKRLYGTPKHSLQKLFQNIKRLLRRMLGLRSREQLAIAEHLLNEKNSKKIKETDLIDLIKASFEHEEKPFNPTKAVLDTVANKIISWKLASPEEKLTKIVFDKLKKDWISIVEPTMEAISEGQVPKLVLKVSQLRETLAKEGFVPKKQQKTSPSVNCEESVYYHSEHGALNVALLETALISHAYDFYYIKENVYEIGITTKMVQASKTWAKRTKDFLIVDVSNANFDDEGPIGYGIKYKIRRNTLYFFGIPDQDSEGRTLIVRITKAGSRILREFELICCPNNLQTEENKINVKTIEESSNLIENSSLKSIKKIIDRSQIQGAIDLEEVQISHGS